jgi:hypothetical protein
VKKSNINQTVSVSETDTVFTFLKIKSKPMKPQYNNITTSIRLKIILLFLLALTSCESKYEGNEAFVDIHLLEELDNFIQEQDSIASSTSTVHHNKSFEIGFHDEYVDCRVSLISNFSYYHSKSTNGYFRFKGKIITVYGGELPCNSKLININKLQKGKIDELADYDDENTLVPPHEPYNKMYNILKGNRLEFLQTGPPPPPDNPNWKYPK